MPDWGVNRIKGAVQTRPDWCISRQRTWGVPIPAFYDAKGEPILDAQIVRNAADLIEKHGSNVWFEKSAAELWSLVKPKDWKGAEAVAKSNDTLDVWIDSGSSSRSVLMRRSGTCIMCAGVPPAAQTKLPADACATLAGRRLSRRQRPASRLVSIVAAALARRQRRGAVQDRAHARLHGGRRPRKNFQEQTSPGRLRKTADRRGLRQKIRRGHRAPVGRVAGLPQRHRRERGTHQQGRRDLSRHPQRAALPALEPLRLRSGEAHRGRRQADRPRPLDSRRIFQARSGSSSTPTTNTNSTSSIKKSASSSPWNCPRFTTTSSRTGFTPTPANSPRRRSTQTTLHRLVTGLCQMLAPILAFTADEAWEFVPGKPTGSVHRSELAMQTIFAVRSRERSIGQCLLKAREICCPNWKRHARAKYWQIS